GVQALHRQHQELVLMAARTGTTDKMLEYIRKHGTATIDELSELAGIPKQNVSTLLRQAYNKGKPVKHVARGVYGHPGRQAKTKKPVVTRPNSNRAEQSFADAVIELCVAAMEYEELRGMVTPVLQGIARRRWLQ